MLKQAGTGDRSGRRGEEARLHDLNRVFRELESQLPRDQATIPPETQLRKSSGRNNGSQQGGSKRNLTELGGWEGKQRHAPPANPRELRSRLKATALVMYIRGFSNIYTNEL